MKNETPKFINAVKAYKAARDEHAKAADKSEKLYQGVVAGAGQKPEYQYTFVEGWDIDLSLALVPDDRNPLPSEVTRLYEAWESGVGVRLEKSRHSAVLMKRKGHECPIAILAWHDYNQRIKKLHKAANLPTLNEEYEKKSDALVAVTQYLLTARARTIVQIPRKLTQCSCND